MQGKGRLQLRREGREGKEGNGKGRGKGPRGRGSTQSRRGGQGRSSGWRGRAGGEGGPQGPAAPPRTPSLSCTPPLLSPPLSPFLLLCPLPRLLSWSSGTQLVPRRGKGLPKQRIHCHWMGGGQLQRGERGGWEEEGGGGDRPRFE